MYDSNYYDDFRAGSRSSAQAIAPLIFEWFMPQSVVDVGCGMAEWLAAFDECGARDLLGLDGEHVDRSRLAIAQDRFQMHDLTMPYRSERRFDLVISVEVAEHLPKEAAPVFVDSLVGLAPVVVFSAAIPAQRGEHHVNCQWPVYWSDLFRDRDYLAFDAFRMKLWDDRRIDWWYRQNLMLYVSRSHVNAVPESVRACRTSTPPALVHPEMMLELQRDLVEWGSEWESKYWNLVKRLPESAVES